MLSYPRACDRDAAENLEDVGAHASRFGGRHRADDQVAHRFTSDVRHPDGRQLSGSMKTGGHGRDAVFTRSPDFIGISDDATSSQRYPRLVIWQCTP
jgi:hypothetical protein